MIKNYTFRLMNYDENGNITESDIFSTPESDYQFATGRACEVAYQSGFDDYELIKVNGEEPILYVAYGSNLDTEQMALRCPTGQFYGKGVLNNWELLFRGNARGCGVATIKRVKGKVVPVGLWKVFPEDVRSLDRYEGYPHLYTKENVYVTMENGKKVKAMVYIMTPGHRPTEPSRMYEETIRRGYKDFELDIRYFDEAIRKNKQELRRSQKVVYSKWY